MAPQAMTSVSSAPSTASTAIPAQTETRPKKGLTISTTIGVGVGMAVLCIIIFTIGFVCVRRRRRKFGFKRKERMEKTPDGDTPDEEIAKRLKGDDGVAEMGGADVKNAQIGAVEADGNARENVAQVGFDEKNAYRGEGAVSELPLGTEVEAQEMPAQGQAHEVGEAAFFIAELDSKEIERRKSLRATPRPGVDPAAPPLPTQQENVAVPSPKEQETTVPSIVIKEPEAKKA